MPNKTWWAPLIALTFIVVGCGGNNLDPENYDDCYYLAQLPGTHPDLASEELCRDGDEVVTLQDYAKSRGY